MKTQKALILMFLFIASIPFAVYSEDEDARLKRLGDLVKEGERREAANMKEFNDKVQEIRSDNSLSQSEKKAKINKEYSAYREKSQNLTVEYRKPAQDELARIANKGADLGSSEASKKFNETAGTKMGDKDHRGWSGDTDAGAGSKISDKVVKTAEKMGLPINKSPKGPGYVNVGGLDLTVHTEGAMGRPGTEAHYVQISSDARSKETYVSAGMDKKQAGKNLVETNDHIKKALEGTEIPHQDLMNSPDKLQIMGKGTKKAISSSGLTNARIENILRKNGINGSPEDFMRVLADVKSGKAIAPDAVGLNSKNIKNAQDACRQILQEAQVMAERKAKIDFAAKQQQIKDLINKGEFKKAQALKDELFDSYVRIKETNKVVGEQLPPSTSGIPEQPVKKGISDATKIKVLFGVGAVFAGYSSWSEEAEAAKKENRNFSQANVAVKFAGHMTGITNAVNQSKVVYNELAKKNYEYLDNEFKALGDMSKVSNARILWITTKSTVRTATKATWEGVKGLPLFIGDIASAAENTVMLGSATTGLVYDTINADMTVQDNKEWQAVTLERGLIAIKKWKIILTQAAGELKMKEDFLRGSEGMLEARDQILDIKFNTEGNIKNLQSMCIQADSLKGDREKFQKSNAEPRLVKLFDEVAKKAESQRDNAEKLLVQVQQGKLTPDQIKKQGGAIKEEFLKNEDAYTKGAEELVDLGKFAEAPELLKNIDSFREGITKSLADANRFLVAAKNIVPSYKKVGGEVLKDYDSLQNFKNELNRKINFFMEKYAKIDSPHYKDLDEIRSYVTGMDIKKPDKETLGRNYDQLEKMLKILGDIENIKIPEVKAELQPEDADMMKQMLANIQKASDEANSSISKAREQIAKLNLDSEGIKIMIAVVDASTGTQIDGATVSVSSKKYDVKLPLHDGVAEFKDVPPGDFKVVANADGYDPCELSLKVDPVSGKDIAETMKLKSNRLSTARAAEQKKEDNDLERKADEVKDAELEKAKDILNNISSMASQGNFLTRHTLFVSRSTSIPYNLCKMSGLKDKNSSVEIILLLGEMPEFYKKGSDLGLAYVIEKATYHLKNMYYDEYKELSRKKNGISGTFTTPTEMSKMALAFVDFELKITEEFTPNVSNMLWYMKYKEYQDKKVQPGQKDKSAPASAADYWASLIVSGGYQSVSSELDKFWAGTSKNCIKGEAAKDFEKKNPFIVKDYRDRYIVMEIAPALEKWSAEKRLAREKEFVVVANELASRLSQAAVNIHGTLKIAPETIPVKVKITNGKQELKQESVNLNKSLKELESESFSFSIEPAIDRNVFNADGTSFMLYMNPGYTDMNKAKFKVTGTTIDVEIPVLNITSYKLKKDEFNSNDKNLVKVPTPPQDKNQEYLAQFNGVMSGYASNTFHLQEAERRYYIVSKAFSGYQRDFSDGYSRTISAMKHNYDVEAGRQDISSQQRQQLCDALNGRIKAVESDLTRLSKQADDISKKANADFNSARDALAKKESEASKRHQELYKEKDALFKQWYESINKFDKFFDEVANVSTYAHRDRNSEIKDYMNPEALSPNLDDNFKKLKGDIAQKFPASLSDILSYESKFQALLGKYDSHIKEADALQMARYGKDPFERDEGSRHFLYSSSRNIYDALQIREALGTVVTVKSMHLDNKLKNDIARIDWYLGKRGGAIQNIEAMIAEMEKFAAQLPDAGSISAAETEIKPVAGKVEAYAKAITSAVMSRNVKNIKIPQGVLDTKGSDEAFVKDCARIMRAMEGQHREVVADWMPPSKKLESAYSKIEEIRFRLPYGEITDEQRKRNDAIFEKLKPMYERYKSKALLEMWPLAIVASLDGLGRTPRERVENLLAKNDKALAEMKKMESDARSLSSIEQAQNFMKDSLDWFGLMPDIPTLDCIKERCELNRLAIKSGVFENFRKSNGLPPPPASVKINGTDVPYDGGCYVMRYSQLGALSADMAKAYDSTEWKGKFTKSFYYGFKKDPDYILEVSTWQEKMFSPWYDTTRDYEWPVSTEYLPMYWTLFVRNATRENKYSRVKYEPGITIVVLP